MSKAKQQKSALPSLDTGPLPLLPIRENARKLLIDAIDTRRFKKALILDPTISGPISLLDPSLSDVLSEHGVIKLLRLEDKQLDDPSYNQLEPRLSDVRNVMYLIRATLENTQIVASQIRSSLLDRKEDHEFSIFFIPRRSIACEKVLEEAGIYANAVIGEYPLDMIAYDEDVLSLDIDRAFRDFVIDSDISPLFFTARAIMKLQAEFGTIPRIQGKGPGAAMVKDICVRMRRELGSAPTAPGRIDRLILVDREVDPVTPMFTQITFEGLIDEVMGIKCSGVPWAPRGKAGEGEGSKGGKSWLLNSTNPHYKELRDLPFYIASPKLHQSAMEARKEFESRHTKALGELKNYVKELPKVMMLDPLCDIAATSAETAKQVLFQLRRQRESDIVENYDLEGTVEFIEELMWRGRDMLEVLRLLVLLSSCNNGVPRRHYDNLRTLLLQTYGHQHVLTILTLEKAGLLKVQAPGRNNWPVLRKAFRLVVTEDEGPATQGQTQPSNDVSHLYQGYAPLSIRLVEVAMKGGWGSVQEALQLLPGPHFDVNQSTTNGATDTTAHKNEPGQEEVVLVVFVGGVTFTEMSALRFLSTRPEFGNPRFITLATKIVNGSTWLQSLLEPEVELSLRKMGG